MGVQFSFNSVFVLTALLILSSAHGYRKLMFETSYDKEHTSLPSMESGGESREMIELDYVYAGPNTNTKSGFLFPPPPAAPPPQG